MQYFFYVNNKEHKSYLYSQWYGDLYIYGDIMCSWAKGHKCCFDKMTYTLHFQIFPSIKLNRNQGHLGNNLNHWKLKNIFLSHFNF